MERAYASIISAGVLQQGAVTVLGNLISNFAPAMCALEMYRDGLSLEKMYYQIIISMSSTSLDKEETRTRQILVCIQ